MTMSIRNISVHFIHDVLEALNENLIHVSEIPCSLSFPNYIVTLILHSSVHEMYARIFVLE